MAAQVLPDPGIVKRPGPASLLLSLLPVLLQGVHSSAQEAQQHTAPFQISVHVDLVVLHATVSTRKGATVAGLREQDFEVYEDGVRQTLRLFRNEDIPVTVGLVVDHSGSMRPKLSDVTAAARTFVKSSNPEDQMFVVNFNEHVTLGLPPGTQFTNRVEDLEAAIAAAPVTGQTALYDATILAFDRLRAGDRDKKALIVISDGGDNASRSTLADVLKTAGRPDALVYTIGIFDADNEDRNTGVLRQLAQATGGEAFFPGDIRQVVAICERIARDIRSQYTLGYVSTRTLQPGGYRRIRVVAGTAETGQLIVRARSGYFAGDPEPQKGSK